MGGPAEDGGGDEPRGDGQRDRHEAVERRRAEREAMQVSLEPFALEVEADRVLAEQFLVVEKIYPRIERADGHIGRQLDGGPEQALADESDAKIVLDVETLLLLEANDGLLEVSEVFGGERLGLAERRHESKMLEAHTVRGTELLGGDLIDRPRRGDGVIAGHHVERGR